MELIRQTRSSSAGWVGGSQVVGSDTEDDDAEDDDAFGVVSVSWASRDTGS